VALIRSRFILTALVVSVAAFIIGLGPLLTDQPAPRSPRDGRPVSPRRSGEDDGFSVLLSRPRDPYLVGRQAIEVEPSVPSGDVITNVDFFLDDRLVATDLEAPFATEVEFGQEIRRHTILVRAVTRAGRRAAVSYISRAASLIQEAAQPIASVPVRVTDAAGLAVADMSVSDFSLTENGIRQPIVHFDRDPGPLSIHFLLHTPGAGPAARSALIGQAAAIAVTLPAYHAFAFGEAGAAPPAAKRGTSRETPTADRTTEKKKDAPPIPTEPFLYDRTALTGRLASVADAGIGRPRPLEVGLAEAAAGLKVRPRGRVLVLLMARPPLPAGPPAPEVDPSGAPPSDRLIVGPALEAALDEVKKSGATVCVVDLGDGSPTDPVLEELAADTGGTVVQARSPEELQAVVDRLADLLLDLYLISYAPSHPERGGWRRIEIATRRPDLSLASRRGVYVEAIP